MTGRLPRFLDWLLGPRCICGQRVFPRDVDLHAYVEHAGDDLTATGESAERRHPLVHGKLLDDTRLCSAGEQEFATVFMSIVDCPACVRAAQARGTDARRCRGCGCTEDRACEPACWWMAEDLCSTCDATGRAL